MNTKQLKTQKLLNCKIENSKITDVTYENNGTFGDISNLPNFFRITCTSSYGKGSLVNTEIWLPQDWNGIYIGLGNGGMAGNIQHQSLSEYIVKGYAVSQTDMGTSGGIKSGINNPELWKDFGWRSTHQMSEISKKLIYNHYGEKAKYSYFIGNSTGGQQAFSEAQRFPEDFDGIISGAPANNRIFLHTYFLWNHNHLRTKEDKKLFTEKEIESISSCAVNYFQSLNDGIKGDNFVSYPYIGSNTVNQFIEFLLIYHPEFSIEQINSLRSIYNGPYNPTNGKQIYNGMPIGSEIYDCGIRDCQNEESPHFYPFIWAFGENYNGYEFDFNKDLKKLSNILSKDLNANNPDLTKFKNHGGKMIAYSGSADPCVPFPDTMNYYERVIKQMDSYKNTISFFRYFLSPGKDHGTTGHGCNTFFGDPSKQTDLLDVIRLWRENGKEPEYIFGAKIKNEKLEFLRKLYPYKSKSNTNIEYPKTCDEDFLIE